MNQSSRAAIATIATMFAIVSAGCGDAGDVASTATTAPAIATTEDNVPPSSVAIPPTAAPAGPPPAAYSDVEAGYSASVTNTLAEGRDALDLLLGGDFEAFHARLGEQMAAVVPIADLISGLDELTSQAPLGARVADRALQLSPSLRVYRAVVGWGDGTVTFTAAFDEASEIADLGLAPQGVLPADPAATYQSQVLLELPFEGLWFVFWGGNTELENYHVVAPNQRHALDLVIWKDGGTHRGDGTANEDYWAYGQRVLAPAGGTVVTAVDGLADNAPQVETDAANLAGNHVVIEVADEEYVLIAHMQAGSLTVAEGDSVTAGQVIGLVGNSGNTSEPHIHIHLQDKPTFDPTATGLPLVFSSYVANGEAAEVGELIADQFVASD
jgi:hypothetical protein